MDLETKAHMLNGLYCNKNAIQGGTVSGKDQLFGITHLSSCFATIFSDSALTVFHCRVMSLYAFCVPHDDESPEMSSMLLMTKERLQVNTGSR